MAAKPARKPRPSGGSLRVIGGAARGRHLQSVPGDTTRPVTDMVKEALFNIIGPDIRGASLLDLFAGTGAIGIEALSRGAETVQFNDLHRLPVDTIRANLSATGLIDGAEVTRTDAFSLLERAPAKPFDYVFIAPPQYKGMWKRALYALDAHPAWLAEDAWVIVQIHPIELEECPDLQELEEFEQRRYGSTLLIFYQKK
jgi:16S rRNA (guanine(966)-N(2))-methyltransferase RsmD